MQSLICDEPGHVWVKVLHQTEHTIHEELGVVVAIQQPLVAGPLGLVRQKGRQSSSRVALVEGAVGAVICTIGDINCTSLPVAGIRPAWRAAHMLAHSAPVLQSIAVYWGLEERSSLLAITAALHASSLGTLKCMPSGGFLTSKHIPQRADI